MKTNPAFRLERTKPIRTQFVFFTAENAEFAEQKGICVNTCPTNQYNLYLPSLRSSRTRRLMRIKANFRIPRSARIGRVKLVFSFDLRGRIVRLNAQRRQPPLSRGQACPCERNGAVSFIGGNRLFEPSKRRKGDISWL
jgi:hypothetical protein